GFFRAGLACGGFLLALAGLGAGFAWAKLVRRGGRSDLGTARVAGAGELRFLRGKDGLLVARGLRLSARVSCEHVAVVGPTGSGKSSAYFIPNLLALEGPASFVVSDPKGELYEKTSERQRALGRKVVVFAPLDPGVSCGYNPVRVASSVTEVKDIAQTLLVNGTRSAEMLTGSRMSQPEWFTMSAPLLAAALLRGKEYGDPDDSVAAALEFLVGSSDVELASEFEQVSRAARREYLIFRQSAGSEATAASIRTVVSTALQLFALPEVAQVTSGETFDPRDLRRGPVALYVVVPERKAAFLSPLMSVFYHQLIEKVLEEEGVPVYFLLDEFANVGVIPEFSRLAATARSRQVSLSVGVQGVEQLEGCYGREVAQDILNNLKTKLFFPGLSEYSAGYASRLCGYATAQTRSVSREPGALGPVVGESYGLQRREVLTPDEVRRLDEKQVLVVAHNRNPVILRQLRYYEDRGLRRLAGSARLEARAEAVRTCPAPVPAGVDP
ncbi:MAG: type IV secretory system conjugative DNA transfer family protein, partial [Bacillota bacterium]